MPVGLNRDSAHYSAAQELEYHNKRTGTLCLEKILLNQCGPFLILVDSKRSKVLMFNFSQLIPTTRDGLQSTSFISAEKVPFLWKLEVVSAERVQFDIFTDPAI